MVVASPPAVAHAPAPSLAALRWRRRVMVIAAPSADDPRLQAQRREFSALTAGSDDRDLRLVTLVGDRVEGASEAASALRRRFHLAADAFRVLLIGKDGGVKLSEGAVTPATRFAQTIDAMPMRRDEARGR